MSDLLEHLIQRERETYENARSCGKEGAGMHRNAGDSGRVAALWMEARRELDEALNSKDVGESK